MHKKYKKNPSDETPTIKATMRRVRLDRGGYTSSGRYFGIGAPLFEMEPDDYRSGIHPQYVRAVDRDSAIRKIKVTLPMLRFHGEKRAAK